MLKRTRWLLLAGMIGSLSASADIAFGDEPVWTRSSKPLVPVEVREVEPNPMPSAIPNAMPSAMPNPPEFAPPEVQGAAFRRYKPAPVVMDDMPPVHVRPKHHHPQIGSYLDRFCQWFFYRAAPNPHQCCMRPTEYRPPLYTWYPYASGNFSNRGGCVVVVVQQPAPTVMASTPGNPAFVNEKLPPPAMPRNTTMERPFIPGSATVMADNPDPATIPPSLIKSSARAPVMEPPVSAYNPIPLPGYLPANMLPKK
jgi:hypothetical protein